jgi:hypothetical protein
MSTRSELMIKIRPKVEFDKSLDSSAAERFQNETLRPIAKFQNEIIISYFLKDLGNIDLPKGSRDRAALIEERLKKNLTLKNNLVGMIVALFTEEEFVIYQSDISSINKRIILLLVQRLQSQL